MLWFLVALLSEEAPSVCYMVVPARRKPEQEKRGETLSLIYGDDGRDSPPKGVSPQLLENENHEKEKSASDFITVDARTFARKLGWSSIHARRNYIFREYWF